MNGFTRLVSFEAPPTARESVYGTVSGDWTPLAYVPGSPAVAAKWQVEWMPMLPSRAESVRQGLEVARDQVRLRMRWRDDITTAQRVRLYGDSETLWQIISMAEIEGRKKRIELMLEKFTTAGDDG